MHTLNRRTFLHLMALAAAAPVAAACDMGAPQASAPTQAAPASAPSVPTVAPTTRSTAVPVRVQLAGGNADVWAWQRQVAGVLAGDCAEAYLAVGDTKAALALDGEHF